MALLKLKNGKTIQDLDTIRLTLAPLNIELAHWPFEKTPKLAKLLSSDVLTDTEKEELLATLDTRFQEQKKIYGYQTRDLVVLHPKTENLDQILKMFDRCHKHSDDEVRYIIDGAGYFGFVMPDQTQVLLLVQAQEYIRVPKNTEHWFVLDNSKRIKAVRYFTSKEGWIANYTNGEIHLQP